MVVHLSNALLSHMAVVDTPGLNTVTEANEETTANFLGVSGREGEQTADAVGRADALVFLLPLLRQADAEVLRGFSKLFGGSALSAASAVAVLSKVDRLSKGGDPLEAAAPIADRDRPPSSAASSAPWCRSSGLLAETAQAAVFTEADARALASVAAVDDPLDREDMLLSAEDFLRFDLLDLDRGPIARRLLSMLDLYGLEVAVRGRRRRRTHRQRRSCKRVRRARAASPRSATAVIERFAGQAEVFKAHAALNDLRRASYLRNDPDNVRALRALRSPLEQIELDPVAAPPAPARGRARRVGRRAGAARRAARRRAGADRRRRSALARSARSPHAAVTSPPQARRGGRPGATMPAAARSRRGWRGS